MLSSKDMLCLKKKKKITYGMRELEYRFKHREKLIAVPINVPASICSF